MAEVIAPKGRLDLATVSALHADLLTARNKDVLCDLGGVTHLGALALQVLVSAGKTAQAQGTRFTLIGARDRVRGQIATMGVDIETLTKGMT